MSYRSLWRFMNKSSRERAMKKKIKPSMSEEGAEVHIVEEAEDEDAPSTRL